MRLSLSQPCRHRSRRHFPKCPILRPARLRRMRTVGGIVGRVSKLNDQFVTIEVAQGVEITLQRQAISQLLPKGTIKAL